MNYYKIHKNNFIILLIFKLYLYSNLFNYYFFFHCSCSFFSYNIDKDLGFTHQILYYYKNSYNEDIIQIH